MIPFLCAANGIVDLRLTDFLRVEALVVARNPAFESICAVARGGDPRAILKVQQQPVFELGVAEREAVVLLLQ